MKLARINTYKRITCFIVIAAVLLSALTSIKLYFSYYSTNKSAQVALAKQYIGIAEDIAEGIDKDIYQEFLSLKQENETYAEIRLYLEEYRSRTHALYVYTLLLDESEISKVMVVSSPPNSKKYPIGIPCTVPSAQVRQAKSGQSYFTDIIKDEHSSSYLSVGVPLKNAEGKLLGVVAIDIDAKELEHISNQVVKSNVFLFVMDVLFAFSLLFVVFVLRQWYKYRSKQDLKQTEIIYLSELGKVVDTIKSSRHDLMNHLQVLNGLMSMRLYDKADDYLKELTYKSKTLNLSLRIQNPVLLVLFQSKWELAQSKGIKVHFETDMNDYSRVESIDLVKIYSNLLDNAIEALEFYTGDQPKSIQVLCKTVGEKYVFAVENPAQLSVFEQKSLFQYGYTSKNNKDAFRGNGLTIIKNTVEFYKGDIYFQYEEGKVLIQITI